MKYIDSQIADECPLITALNARIKLGLESEPYDIQSKKHEDLVHLFNMDIGPTELFTKDYQYLQLKKSAIEALPDIILSSITQNSCVEGILHNTKIGWHSFCLVHKKDNMVHIVNIDDLNLEGIVADIKGGYWIDINKLLTYNNKELPPNLKWNIISII